MFKCPECDLARATPEGVDRHRASNHGLPIFAEEPVSCPDCDHRERNLNALARHRRDEHGHASDLAHGFDYDETNGAIEPRQSAYRAVEHSYYPSSNSGYGEGWFSRVFDGAIGGFAFLWVAVKWLFGIGILVAIILAIAGVGDKKEVAEDPSSPGYSILRDSSLSNEVDDYKAVEPDEGWDSEYEVNGGDVTLRFRGSEMKIEGSGYAEDLANALRDAAASKGYYSRGGQ